MQDFKQLKKEIREKRKVQSERILLLKTLGHIEPKPSKDKSKYSWKLSYSIFRYLMNTNTNVDYLNSLALSEPKLYTVLENAYVVPTITIKMKLEFKKHLTLNMKRN